VRYVSSIVGALAASAIAASSYAASINVTGRHTVSQADTVGVLANGAWGFADFSSGTGNNRVSGRVEYANGVFNGVQRMGLTLTQFSFVGDGATTQTVTINLVQDFALADGASGTAFAAQTVQGRVNFGRAGQLAQGSFQSAHEGVNLPLVGFNPNAVLSGGAASSSISRSSGNQQGISVVGNVYRIAVQYTFTINAAGGIVSVELPQSLGDVATLVLVPLPPAGWAGLAGLGLVGYASYRRKKLAAVQG
jgi:hypothetical protein